VRRTLLFILPNENSSKNHLLSSTKLLRAPQNPFPARYLFERNMSWVDFEVEDKIVVLKYKDRVDIIERYHEREEISIRHLLSHLHNNLSPRMPTQATSYACVTSQYTNFIIPSNHTSKYPLNPRLSQSGPSSSSANLETLSNPTRVAKPLRSNTVYLHTQPSRPQRITYHRPKDV